MREAEVNSVTEATFLSLSRLSLPGYRINLHTEKEEDEGEEEKMFVFRLD